MNNIVIQVENLSKYYSLGVVGTGTLSHDLNRAWAKLRGKPDPTLRVDQLGSNQQSAISNQQSEDDYIWALRDINFEVKRGEVLGIIGRNGAGKSTLLKILSRVTAPTSGECRVKGRIASLLEVGTGFHPELTGRENIFLNGAILGMIKEEINQKFDEIVDFAEVEKFIDTPVKRYSSGMYVRLAFAVAANLEPEILLVDEVLAVGDVEFQKKCLGKMGDVSKEGRTVLFVSHNMLAMKNLCQTGLLLNAGRGVYYKSIDSAIDNYLKKENIFTGEVSWDSPDDSPGNHQIRLKAIRIISDMQASGKPIISKNIDIQIDYWNLEKDGRRLLSIHLFNALGYLIITSANMKATSLTYDPWVYKGYQIGLFRTTCTIPKFLLNTGTYSIDLYINGTMAIDNILFKRSIISFDVQDDAGEYCGEQPGAIRPKLAWKTELLTENI